MKSSAFFTGIIVFALAWGAVSCSSTRKLGKGENLLVKNTVTADSKEIPTKTEVTYLIKPSANSLFLGLYPLRAALYQQMLAENGKKDRKWKQWVRKNFGEEPVLLDSTAVENSTLQLRQYLRNNGYFESEVETGIRCHRQKAKVEYRITAGQPYRLNELSYRVADTNIRRLLLEDRENSLLQKGMRYSTDRLDEERKRIATLLANQGYYTFKTDHIQYRIDSNLNSHRFNLTVVIQNNTLRDSSGNTQSVPFRKYYIKDVEILYYHLDDKHLYSETHMEKDALGITHPIRLLHSDEGYYKPKALTRPLVFSPNSRYSLHAAQTTYNRYNDMQNFRFIRIGYAETEESRLHPLADSGWLNCRIQLSQAEKHKLNFELLGKDIGTDYGIGVNLNLRNINAFHGGEIQYNNLIFSTEFERNQYIDENNSKRPVWRYRNFEFGGEAGIHFPLMLFPYGSTLIPKKYRAQTRLSVGSYFQQRDHYSRLITNTGLEYDWRPSSRASHILKLLDINIVNIYKDSVFDRNLASYSQRIREKYTNHVLVGSNYKYLYSSLKKAKRQNYFLLRLNVNTYGNLLYGLFSLSGAKKNANNQYTVAGTPFTSFVSGEVDFTYNFLFGQRSSFVVHTNSGIGAPTFNASTLPFERSFYLGGSNSMRAWNLRSLGPGGYRGNLSHFESSGDIKLEWNAELRTPLYKNFYSALFIDIGNIWNLRENADLPLGEFAWDRFYKELAMDGGVGIRWDISFLVLRVDMAMALYKPYGDEAQRWIDKTASLSDLRFCFGIGYPF